MNCEYLNPVEGKPCSSYLGSGMCARSNMFRCPEYIKHKEPRVSHSAIENFMRCHLRYYYSNIQGVQVKPMFQSDALKIGSQVDDYITQNKNPDGMEKLSSMREAKIHAICQAFDRLVGRELVDYAYQGQKVFLTQEDGIPQTKGYIDLEANDVSHFIEIKTSEKPERYTNLFWMRSQMGTYFLSNPNYKYGIIWPIRVPTLKRTGQYKEETLEEYRNRCIRDMVARAKWYFPGYNPDEKTFGIKIYRSEIDLDVVRKRYQMIGWQIQKCAEEGFWYPEETQCLSPFECDFKRICENHGCISEDVYCYREKEEHGIQNN